MYYLNAFNEMLKKRQQQNNMMGGGQDYGVGTTAPSGPMGARQSGNGSMAGFRNALANPAVNFAASMIPALRAPLAFAKLANYGISAYEDSQNTAREQSQDRFRASEIADMNAPMQNTPQQSFQTGEITANRAATDYTDYSDVFTDRTSTAVPSTIAPPSTLDTTTFGGDAAAAGPGAGFGGNVGTGDFGGSPADAADMGYAHGGMVDARHLKGRAPAPDDGYGALQGGEYVITKAAVEKYGKRLLDAINNGTFR